MKMLLMVEFPHEPFNALVRSGKIGEIMNRILETIKPEATYFTEQDGMRSGIFLIDIEDPSEIPGYAEPFFLNFQANCKFRVVMSAQNLQDSGLEELGKAWG
ncbi:panthothenate synthetase [Pseudomonas frederiksbergensis]|uniref:panthothenate synthetase n=1 Tax=Pseudomonas cucumis TaxID=2954082 RepID=UPI0021852794|nr:panthothenate synthetase [Pseudomonas cucumis]URM30764.1 panthothenate synthetase [Pseudomonas frederiksbergensis]WLG88582.1 panthothenate synthetase [Pseudomonas cucumis]